MTYSQTIYDNCDGSVIDTTKWSIFGNPGGWITESSGKMHFAPNDTSDLPGLNSTQYPYDVSNGICAFKMYQTGITDGNEAFYFGLHDSSGNYVIVLAYPSSDYMGLITSGSVSVSGVVWNNVGSLKNVNWINGDWIGIGTIGSDSVVHVYRSSDGVTWTDLMTGTLSGTFAKSAVGPYIKYQTYTATWGFDADDVSYFGPSASNKYNVRSGGAWVSASPKVRVTGTWVEATPKVRSGGAWITPTPV